MSAFGQDGSADRTAGGAEALADITVLEFGGYAAGPAIGKYLANFGARVIHVESAGRPDGFRLQYPPFKDDKPGLNRSGCFGLFNDSKLGITLDLKNPSGASLALRMIAKVDVIIENMRPGVMDKLGLGYERLRKVNPRLVMLSTSNMGTTGPYASHPGFGSQLSSLSGFTELIGSPDGPPNFLYGPYIDMIAVAYGGVAILAAVDRCRRTGAGAFIDIAQLETGLQFIAPALLDFDLNGTVARRDGNRDRVAVPHGCYPTRDGWCVISCWDEAEWERFCAAATPAWRNDPRFATANARREHELDLNAEIGRWTATRDAFHVMQTLQARNVHAAVVQTMADLFRDPQIAERNIWQARTHPEMEQQHYRMVSYQLSDAPGRVTRSAPCVGEHNDVVFREWLELSDDEYRELAALGVFS